MISKSSSADFKSKRVYGRRINRPLSKTRKEAIEKLLPALSVPEELLKEDQNLNPENLFQTPKPQTWMEIGFGNGEHLRALIEKYPDINFIGAEPFINGMATFLRDIQGLPQDNIRVWMDDALLLVCSLEDECLDRLYILNPDPWPKKRHHKRRIINQENLDQLARVLRPDRELIMATDVDDMAEWMVTECMLHPALEWSATSSKDWEKPPADWIKTRYAAKGEQQGHKQTFLVFRKKPLPNS